MRMEIRKNRNGLIACVSTRLKKNPTPNKQTKKSFHTWLQIKMQFLQNSSNELVNKWFNSFLSNKNILVLTVSLRLERKKHDLIPAVINNKSEHKFPNHIYRVFSHTYLFKNCF